MNLLDKASIILTPSAYNNGEALCVKPSDGSGDFDFSRNSAATRVNAQGLVEDVQILSSNLVQNGDFSEQGAEEVSNGSFSQQGSQLITNGDFSVSTGWQGLNANRVISEGKLNINMTSGFAVVYQPEILSVGTFYKCTVEVSNYVDGGFKIGLAGSDAANTSPNINADGTFTFYLQRVSGGTNNIGFVFDGLTNLSIDNVSVVEVGQNFTFGTGWGVAEDKAVCDGTQTSNSGLVQQGGINGATINFVVGKTYKVNFDVVVTSGVITMIEVASGLDFNSITASGNHTTYITAVSTNNRFTILANPSFIGSVTNISVKEVGQNWTLGTGWSIGDNKLVREIAVSGSYAQTSYDLGIIGNNYQISIDVAEVTSGILYVYGGLGGTPAISITSAGVYKINHIWASDQPLGIFCNNSFVGKVNSISVIEITDDTNLPRINYEGFSYQDALGSEEIVNGDFSTNTWWTVGQFWSIANGFVTRAVVGSELNYSVSRSNLLTIGKSYKVEIDINSVDSGSVRVVLGSTNGAQYTSAGVYIFEGVCTSSTNFKISPSNDFNGSIDNVSVKEVLGQEIVPDSGCGSWLWENQSTNLITQSELFSDSYWTKSGASVVSGFISPDGTSNAYKLVEDTSTGVHSIKAEGAGVVNDYQTTSIYVKYDNSQQFMQIQSSSIVGNYVNFDILNKTFSNFGTSIGNITELPSGWLRLEAYHDSNTRVRFNFVTSLTGGWDESYLGTGKHLLIFGSQNEALSYPTSYIPTDGTQKTRNQDVCNNGGSAASINSSEGVLYFEFKPNNTDTSTISISDNGSSNLVQIYVQNGGNNVRYRVTSGNTVQFDNIVATAVDLTDNNKYALKWKANDFSLWLNGTKINSQTTGLSPIGLNNLAFYSVFSAGQKVNGNTKALAVWKEALSDEELAELTTI